MSFLVCFGRFGGQEACQRLSKASGTVCGRVLAQTEPPEPASSHFRCFCAFLCYNHMSLCEASPMSLHGIMSQWHRDGVSLPQRQCLRATERDCLRATKTVARTQVDGQVEVGQGGYARKSRATGSYCPSLRTNKIATPRCWGNSVNRPSRSTPRYRLVRNLFCLFVFVDALVACRHPTGFS